jgi:hypothetical protein
MAARTKVSFATCNLYNLHLSGRPIYRDADGWSQEEYDAKLDWLSRMFPFVNAGCWGFQELWHKDALVQAFDRAGLLADYHLMVPENHDGNSIVCGGAVVKDHLVGEPEWIDAFPEKLVLESGGDDPQTPDISIDLDRFSRPLLHFQIKPRSDGKVIHVFVAHLKSKLPTAIYREGWYRGDADYYRKHSDGIGSALSTIRRSAEAAALRMILVDLMKDTDTPVVVLGDMNDAQMSNTLNIITGPTNYLVSGLSQGGSDVNLYTVGALQQYRSLRDVYYTHIHQNQQESLDHIIVSQEFYDNAKKRIWAFKGMEIFNDHLNQDDHKANGTSDHGIVKAAFEYRPNRG